jgi:citrate lyase subunit beta/citryl-CoA lyase/(S)-citramalyl-CoA lyase
VEKILLAAFPQVSVILPKLTTPDDLGNAIEFYGIEGRNVVGLIEDAAALEGLEELLKTGLLAGLGLGLEDFLSDSIFRTDQCEQLLQHIRSRIALAAMSYGVIAIDTISFDFSEGAEALRKDSENARSAGMTAKFSIHPNQVRVINECFAPDTDLLEQAKDHQDLLETIQPDAKGYFKVDEEIFSPPKIKKLKKILEWARLPEEDRK